MKKPKKNIPDKKSDHEPVMETLKIMKSPRLGCRKMIRISKKRFRKMSKRNPYGICQRENRLELL